MVPNILQRHGPSLFLSKGDDTVAFSIKSNSIPLCNYPRLSIFPGSGQVQALGSNMLWLWTGQKPSQREQPLGVHSSFAVGLPMSPIPSWTCGQHGCWGPGVGGRNHEVILCFFFLLFLQCRDLCCAVMSVGCSPQLLGHAGTLVPELPKNWICWISNHSDHSGFFQPFSAADSEQTYGLPCTGVRLGDSFQH